MSALLRIYDNVTSNKYVSLGATVVSTAFILYDKIESIAWFNPTVLIIGLCAGSAFALLANTYLAHNESIKTEGTRNTIYATLSLLNGFTHYENSRTVSFIYYRNISNSLYARFGSRFCDNSLFTGLKIGFSATILALQVFKESF